MNFFEQEMRFMLENNTMLKDMKFCGKKMVAKLDEDKIFKAKFISTKTANEYTAIRATIINKNSGVVDSTVFKFSDIIGLYNRGNGLAKIEPYMWDEGLNPRWYTPISNQQKLDIGNTVLEYGEMFQDTQYALSMQFK